MTYFLDTLGEFLTGVVLLLAIIEGAETHWLRLFVVLIVGVPLVVLIAWLHAWSYHKDRENCLDLRIDTNDPDWYSHLITELTVKGPGKEAEHEIGSSRWS